MSPILVRPVREQLEHDRVIRLLQAKFRRRFEVAVNVGNQQVAPVGVGASALFPDVVLYSPERSRRLLAVVEVETGESVNHLEALAEWSHLAKLRVPFHLYVPSGMMEVARQLCDDNHIEVGELWAFHTVIDDVRFTLVQRNKNVPDLAATVRREPKAPARAAEKAPGHASKKAAPKRAVPKKAAPKKPAKPAKPVKAAKLSVKAKPSKPTKAAAVATKKAPARKPTRGVKAKPAGKTRRK